MKTVLGITGTTSVGKSATAMELAKLLNTAVISADSMQIYRGMNVGTAKITPSEMKGVAHYMLDIAEPCDEFSSFLYARQAAEIIDSMTTTPIVVGGTGFYFDSLVYPPEFGEGDPARRKELLEIYEREGIEPLRQILSELDGDAYAQIDNFNYKRVIRAIEIAEKGESVTRGNNRQNPRYNLILYVLQRDREELYAKIDERVDKMVQNGLIEEVRGLIDKYGYCKTSAFEAIGYKEIIEYLKGNCTLEQAVCQIKTNTRRYAKRQISYYKRMNVAEYIDADGKTPLQIANYIYEKVQKLL